MFSRIAKSVALGAALTLTLGGCALLAPIATEHPYDPSDGVGTDVASVNVRNLMIIADKRGGNYNVVFTAVNKADTAKLAFTFVTKDGKEETASFDVQPGRTLFGNPAGDQQLALLDLGEQEIGSTVTTFVTAGSENEKLYVPVLDGTLDEYKPYVVKEPSAVTGVNR